MKKRLSGFGIAMLVPAIASCEGLVDIIAPPRVTVTVVNASLDFPVEATFSYSDEDDLTRDLLIELGTQREITVAPGETMRFTLDCGDLRSVVLEDADLLVIVGIGPETESDILRDGDEFNCGDEIVFTFNHSDLIVDFDVSLLVR